MADVNTSTDDSSYERVQPREKPEASPLFQYLLAASVVFGATLLLFFLRLVIGYRSVALIYLLAEVVLAMFVGRGPTLLIAALSALLWDFCFVAPLASFRIDNVEDGILLGMYFVVALVLGQLISRIRAQEKACRQGEERMTALYQLTRDLDAAITLSQLFEKVARHFERGFGAGVVILLPDATGQLSLHPHPASTDDIAGPEQPAAEWAFREGVPAGKFTEHLPQADTHFVPLKAGERAAGVIGLKFAENCAPNPPQRNLLEAFVQHIALALDRHRLREQAGQMKLLGESERLSRTLLNSVSHEIRTPLSALKSAASTFADASEPQLSTTQKAMIAEIQEAVERLDGLVGKVLDITRLEGGRVNPKLSPCDVSDLVHVALKETKKQLARHKVTVDIDPGLPLVRADFVLLQQALMNILSNAAIHTPPGTAVQVKAGSRDETLILSVGDRGRGIPPEALARVFDKFYRAPGAPTGGTGLGLSLVKGFVEAQGGQVKAESRPEGGTVFTIRLPLGQTNPELSKANL